MMTTSDPTDHSSEEWAKYSMSPEEIKQRDAGVDREMSEGSIGVRELRISLGLPTPVGQPSGSKHSK
jgi:hypothetical protein